MFPFAPTQAGDRVKEPYSLETSQSLAWMEHEGNFHAEVILGITERFG